MVFFVVLKDCPRTIQHIGIVVDPAGMRPDDGEVAQAQESSDILSR
jgi:hypothetical protein